MLADKTQKGETVMTVSRHEKRMVKAFINIGAPDSVILKACSVSQKELTEIRNQLSKDGFIPEYEIEEEIKQ
jgi:hypothetical protein